MEKLFLTVLIMMFCVGVVNAATLKWDASTGDVDGYYAYYGTKTGMHPERYDVGNVTEFADIVSKLRLLSSTKYFFAVAAYNEAGEGDKSNEAEYTTPTVITMPGPVTITITTD